MNERFFDDKVWSLKYRPKTINDLILPKNIKNQIFSIIESDNCLNYLFYGSAGTGKTTAAGVIADTLDREIMYINGSLETGIDVLRTKIAKFVSTVSMDGTKKIVIVDEADRSSAQAQDAYKSFLEEFSKISSFIFISNHHGKIIAPLHSRLQAVDFYFKNEDMKELKSQFFKRVLSILQKEKIDYNGKVIAFLVDKIFPDMRKILTEIQKASQQGTLNDLSMIKGISSNEKMFFSLLKEKNFSKMRKYLTEVSDASRFFMNLRPLYDEYIDDSSKVQFAMLLANYCANYCAIPDAEITTTSFACECWTAGIKLKDCV